MAANGGAATSRAREAAYSDSEADGRRCRSTLVSSSRTRSADSAPTASRADTSAAHVSGSMASPKRPAKRSARRMRR